MEKSIESIWNKGFLNSEELTAPKINDLYNKKSELVIEKIKKTYTMDMKLGVLFIGIIVLILCFFTLYYTALYTAFTFTLLFLYNKNLIKSLENIDITTNSYDYLVTYRTKFKQLSKKNAIIMGTIFPLVILLGYYITYTELGIYDKVMLIFGSLNRISIFIISYVVTSLCILFVYYLSIKIMYGASLKKIDTIITDIKELRA